MIRKGDYDVAKSRSKAPAPNDVVRFGLYLDRETRTALRRIALDKGTSATKLVEQLIHDYLATHARKAPRTG
jgi:hypothetical protein